MVAEHIGRKTFEYHLLFCWVFPEWNTEWNTVASDHKSLLDLSCCHMKTVFQTSVTSELLPHALSLFVLLVDPNCNPSLEMS